MMLLKSFVKWEPTNLLIGRLPLSSTDKRKNPSSCNTEVLPLAIPQIDHSHTSVHLLRILQWWGKTTKGPIRAVASIYSWGGDEGGVGQKFPNDEKNFLIFHAGIRSHEGVCYPENGDAIYKHKYAYFTRRHITVACSAIGTSI